MIPTIQTECSEFLSESIGHPLIKNLPKNKEAFRKVKVRKKKQTEIITTVFNETFEDDHSEILQRSIFAHGSSAFTPSDDEQLEPFYIFPIDGYRYMYAANVLSTTENYRATLDLLLETLGDTAIETFQEVLKYHYRHDKLYEALTGNSEIIIYDIPYYYAIRRSIIENYGEFIFS
jgi:hypothetical protein